MKGRYETREWLVSYSLENLKRTRCVTSCFMYKDEDRNEISSTYESCMNRWNNS